MHRHWPWVGTWIAADLKTITIAREGQGLTVTVSPGPDQVPYTGAPLPDGSEKTIDRLPAHCHTDRGLLYLQVEAGIPGIGPTYHLYGVVDGASGYRAANEKVPAEQLTLLPDTGIGFYDDWEDDLGVPWAYPLQPLKWRANPDSTS